MTFEVKAMRGNEGVITLRLDAADEEAARGEAQRQGYAVLSIKPGSRLRLRLRRQRFPLLLFTQELLTLLDAGPTLSESLETLAEKQPHAETRKLIESLVAALYEGQTFSAALEQHREVFPPLYVAMIRASEKTGGLSDALGRYSAYHAQLDTVRKKLVSASIYPILLLLVGGLVILFLLGYIVPKFSHIYADAGGELPLMARWLMAWGNLVEARGALLFGILAAALAGAGLVLSRPGIRRRLGELLWRLPALGERMKVYQLARFYRALGMLLRGGLPIVRAIDMSQGLLPAGLHAPLAKAARDLREGRSISQTMEANGLTTPVALRLLRVGERSGRMGEMMERIAVFHDEEMARWVDWATRLFEPLLMTFIGLVIGAIVVLMYLPIFELAGSLQ